MAELIAVHGEYIDIPVIPLLILSIVECEIGSRADIAEAQPVECIGVYAAGQIFVVAVSKAVR